NVSVPRARLGFQQAFCQALFPPCRAWAKAPWPLLCAVLEDRDVESVAAGVNDRDNVHTLPDVIEVTSTEDRHRRYLRERAQNCPSRAGKPSLFRLTDDRCERAVVIEKNREAAGIHTSDFFYVLKCRRKHFPEKR